jgi:hypothetical protein
MWACLCPSSGYSASRVLESPTRTETVMPGREARIAISWGKMNTCDMVWVCS